MLRYSSDRVEALIKPWLNAFRVFFGVVSAGGVMPAAFFAVANFAAKDLSVHR
jgi:hypothetical protein